MGTEFIPTTTPINCTDVLNGNDVAYPFTPTYPIRRHTGELRR